MIIINGSSGIDSQDNCLTLARTASDEWRVTIWQGSLDSLYGGNKGTLLAAIFITDTAAQELRRALAK